MMNQIATGPAIVDVVINAYSTMEAIKPRPMSLIIHSRLKVKRRVMNAKPTTEYPSAVARNTWDKLSEATVKEITDISSNAKLICRF